MRFSHRIAASGHLDRLEDAIDEIVGRELLRLRFVRRDYAMAEDVVGHRPRLPTRQQQRGPFPAVAAAGLALHQLTGNAYWDAGAAIAIGVLLAVVAYLLGRDTKEMLIGESAPAPVRTAILAALAGPSSTVTTAYAVGSPRSRGSTSPRSHGRPACHATASPAPTKPRLDRLLAG